ncbi:MAG: DUF922 domain-containing protein [Sphingobacteriales bacterium]|nr:DUF922 domain-containing protein [Sphingobacteriales bacterium]
MKGLLAVLFIFSIQSAGKTQRVIIDGKESSPILTWDDFKGRPDEGSTYNAFTYWYVSYGYDAFQFKGDTAKWKVKVTLELENRSWKKDGKVNDSLLIHEQGHFDIGRICALEVQRKVDNTVFFRSNYAASLKQMVDEIIEKYRKMEKDYDKETDHYHNREQQKKWDNFFMKELDKYR